MNTESNYRFSFGPWNIGEGGDPFGPDVRPAFPHEEKYALFRSLGLDPSDEMAFALAHDKLASVPEALALIGDPA
jgi:hypothetical protein